MAMKKSLVILLGTLLVVSAMPYSAFAKQRTESLLMVNSQTEFHVCHASRTTEVFRCLSKSALTDDDNLTLHSISMETNFSFIMPDSLREFGLIRHISQ